MGGQGQSLHRLTNLLDDPVSTWLPVTGRALVAVAGSCAWAGFAMFVGAVWMGLAFVMSQTLYFFSFRVASVGAALIGGALFRPVHRSITRMKSGLTATKVRSRVPSVALPVDDWTALSGEPEGRVVSVVGWARGRAYLSHLVGGERCIGLALPCRDTHPGVLENLLDFDLVDESGQSVRIAVDGARMLGESNTRLHSGSNEDRLLVASLDLPTSAVPSDWRAFAIRDGDPLMVVGFKHTIIDPHEPGMRRNLTQSALGSSQAQPLLIFSIPAERRTV
jgi:hypothetical protein